jgi:hypothetical protein
MNDVAVRLAWLGPQEPQSHGSAMIHARRVDGAAAERDFDVQDGKTIALPSGQWFLSASATGYWSEPRLVTASPARPEVLLELEPATRVHAIVKLPRPAKASELTIHLQTFEAQPRTRSVVCAIAGERLDCDVPAGRQDLVFRIAGYSSVFRWGETLDRPRADLGTLTFRRGSTFSGRVEIPPGRDAKVDVILAPAGETPENDAFRARRSVARQNTRPNARGYFAFNVAPGRYVVHATAGDLISDEEEVTVVDGREAVLRDTLRLAPKRTLTINVHPAADPWNKTWKVTASRRNAAGIVIDQRTAETSPSGSVRLEGILPGTYSVSVHRSSLDEWFAARIEVDGDATLDVRIATTRVRGSVTLGKQPVAALITFFGENGMRLPVHSKADGTFLTLLPTVDGDKWHRVDVECTSPRVKRTLTDVALSGADSPEASLDIQLPSTSMEGIVVDGSSGEPAQNALVNIVTSDRDFKQIESADGTFAVAGLAPGRCKVAAATRFAESDAPIEVDLADGETKRVTITVDAITRLRGAVRSSFGNVATAGIFAIPAGSDPQVISAVPVTADGRFDVRLPPRTGEAVVTAAAPGFSFRMLRMPVPAGGGDSDIAVDQQGGTLIVEAEDARSPLRPYLIHNGVALPANVVAYLSSARPLANAREMMMFQISPIEAGAYSLCWMPRADVQSDRCASGTLARNGTLTLQAPPLGARSFVLSGALAPSPPRFRRVNQIRASRLDAATPPMEAPAPH